MTKQKRVSFSIAQTRFFEQPTIFPSDSDGALEAASLKTNAFRNSSVSSTPVAVASSEAHICHSAPTTRTTTSLEELKVYRWYTSEELNASREDARQALHALQAVNGRVELVDSTKFCIRGMEQYVDVVSKVRRQQLLKRSILNAQYQSSSPEEEESSLSTSLKKSTSSSSSLASLASSSTTSSTSSTGEEEAPRKRCRACPEQLAAISGYLSQASRDLAHHFAVLNAQEILGCMGEPSVSATSTSSAPTSPIGEADPSVHCLPPESANPHECKKRHSPSGPSMLPETGSPQVSHGFCRYVKLPRLQ